MSHAVVDSSAVSRLSATPSVPTRRIMRGRIDSIRPVIRIAHRVRKRMEIPLRLIFDYEVVLVVRGSGTFAVGGDEYPFNANDVLCIPPFAPHTIDQTSSGACEHIAVHFDFAPDLPPRGDDLADRTPYVVRFPGASLPRAPIRASERLAGRFEAILVERDASDALAELAASSTLTETLVELMRASAASVRPPITAQEAKIATVLAYIGKHYASPVALDDLAAVADLSQSRFSTLFRETTGSSPMDYVQRTRIAEARKLLGDVALSVKEIASRVGFDDALHFSRVFRRIDGLSPSQYRNALLARGSQGE